MYYSCGILQAIHCSAVFGTRKVKIFHSKFMGFPKNFHGPCIFLTTPWKPTGKYLLCAMKIPWRGHENSRKIFIFPYSQDIHGSWFAATHWKLVNFDTMKFFGREIHGFLSTFEKAMKCHFHGYFMASRSLYSIFHGSWIWKFSQVFHGIFQVFFMVLRPWKCHWFNHEKPMKNMWIYNELFQKIFIGFYFIVDLKKSSCFCF